LLKSHTIDVAVINRVAYLSGAVNSNLQKAEAQDVASRIKGVLSVRNHLKVDPEFNYHDWPYYQYNE
jgi:osmotically-inducible protein OsmY